MLTFNREDIASALGRVADLLAEQAADRGRVVRWRAAAATVAGGAPSRLEEVAGSSAGADHDGGPTVDGRVARQIGQLLQTGRMGLLERLEGRLSPEEQLGLVPGVGPTLARRIVALGVETMDDVRAAAQAGALARIAGVGPRRSRALLTSLELLLAGPPRPGPAGGDDDLAVTEEELLALDAVYRQRAAAGALVRIATARHGAGHGRWLPVMHVDRGSWSAMVHFANSARAHAPGKTGECVVVHCQTATRERQYAIASEERGSELWHFDRLTRPAAKAAPASFSDSSMAVRAYAGAASLRP